jgi:hypothetical protein
LGGEPTLHPDLFKIIDLIKKWRSKHVPGAIIELKTNGYGNRVKDVLKLLPDDIIITSSNKNNREQEFDTYNIAPLDKAAYKFADFRNGCWITKHSGIGLTPYGYYPCGPAGAIDRVFGFNIGRNRLPDTDDCLYDQLQRFCSLCGHFERRFYPKLKKPSASKTWKHAYKSYNTRKPVLSLYGERENI